jgi:hypothetical protein
MHARIDPLPSPSWTVRIWDDSSPSQDRAYCSVVTIASPPPVAFLVGEMVRGGGRWTKAHRRALADVLWCAGYRLVRWTGFREGKSVMRTVVLTPPKEHDDAEHEDDRPLHGDRPRSIA